jgi:hypothetical protein
MEVTAVAEQVPSGQRGLSSLAISIPNAAETLASRNRAPAAFGKAVTDLGRPG